MNAIVQQRTGVQCFTSVEIGEYQLKQILFTTVFFFRFICCSVA